ncbi:NADH:flavin oxidoreductase/NADH oxidase [Gymnopus androsaceus JB14]|uniref:NADH:flavin oxidoreductase/NADH oxidase n=1 Tax=Gymnopus androsaceus JB14 TaxID=1447944 RepID=A0A6A4H5D8_9AGAR|nr:NADH:flavin oxidoreductase/NADH oxidase [Gymnopus androsaceus JB14]
MSTSTSSSLFQPIQVGNLLLKHRVVLAPLTRMRCDDQHVPQLPVMREYYSQRSSTPGTLLIAEGTLVDPKAGGYPNVPGLWNDVQSKAWKEITDAVHKNGSHIFVQLWTTGRDADPKILAAENPEYTLIGPSEIPMQGKGVPRALEVDEIKSLVQSYAKAASLAVNKAGFDGVEIHFANGYLVNQFLEDVSNNRKDEYGGSIENRARFGLEVVDAVVREIGQEKVGARFSPWSTFLDMRMKDPIPTYSYVIKTIKDLYPNFAYISVCEPRVVGDSTFDANIYANDSNDFIRDIWSPKPLIVAGGFDRESAIKRADSTGDLIAFGRRYISNPDLPKRLLKNLPLTPYDRSTFYLAGDASGRGYSDWPFAEEVSR